MHDQVGPQRLLERGREGLHELVGQLADEADGVGEQVGAPRDLERARGGVERVEEPVAHAHLGAGQRVEQRRLAGVGVAGQRHRGQARALALAAHRVARAARVDEPALERGDAVARQAAVGLDLGLARSAGADAAVHAPGAEALEMGPEPAHAGEVVLELGQLDLELALGRVGVVGEDVEDDRRAVDHRHVERLLEVALLARLELVVAGHEVGPRVGDRLLELGRACPCRSSGRDRAAGRRWVSSPTTATPAVRSSSLSSARSARRKARRRCRTRAGARADCGRPRRTCSLSCGRCGCGP